MSQVLPAWMYRDPAEVVERRELQAIARLERERKARQRPEERGLSPVTVLQMRRLRIRELVSRKLKGER